MIEGKIITGNQSKIKDINKQLLLIMIRQYQPISRVELSEKSGLNKSTVSKLIRELINEGYIKENGRGKSIGGRKPVLLDINPSAIKTIAVAISVNTTTVVLADANSHIEKESSFDTISNPKDEFYKIAEISNEFYKKGKDISEVVFSIPGIVDVENKVIKFAPNLHWRNIKVDEVFRERFEFADTLISIDNEANFSVLAESWMGNIVKNEENIVYILINEGIGTGLIINNRLFRGYNYSAGEFGHMIINEGGRKCQCGNFGCWERYGSIKVAVDSYNLESPYHLRGKNNEEMFDSFVDNCNKGDELAIKIAEDIAKELGVGIANIVNGLDPELVIIGGRMVKLWDYIKDALIRTIEEHAIFGSTVNLRIEPTSFKAGTSSIIGAAVYGIRKLYSGYHLSV
ncbi:MAG: ROK family transcriptional regulator [Thermoproteales archaeon]|nr:ROK family transcriptional regulator [Thermoproteales archaeon]